MKKDPTHSHGQQLDYCCRQWDYSTEISGPESLYSMSFCNFCNSYKSVYFSRYSCKQIFMLKTTNATHLFFHSIISSHWNIPLPKALEQTHF